MSIPPYLYLNGLFILIVVIGFLGISHIQWVGSGWLAITWVTWIILNYLFIIRIKLCRHCKYYGHRCPLGWGILIPFLCSKGDSKKFSGQKWPVLYLISYAVIPPVLMFVSLTFLWDPWLFSILVIFILSGILLYWLAGSRCCANCKMISLCLLSKINDFF